MGKTRNMLSRHTRYSQHRSTLALSKKKSNLVSFGVHEKDEKVYWGALNGGPQNAVSIS